MSKSRSGVSLTGNGKGPSTLAQLARLRQRAYRLFSQSLLYPHDRRLTGLALTGAELDAQSHLWAAFAFFPQWSALLERIKKLDYADARSLQVKYVSTFLVNRAGIPCPLYESAYLGEDPSLGGYLMAELESEYAQMGLSSPANSAEPPDHAAVQMEFMYFVCGREAEAWECEELQLGSFYLARECDFLHRHLGWWFREFARKVMTEDADGLFAAQARAADAFLVHDIDLISAMLQRFESFPVAEVP
ncbi:MAG: molecular chaperone TorD family protein [Chloroflexi bacterium]|nr:molecular chaperone TorD family protein [Chloroflexota bacterium]